MKYSINILIIRVMEKYGASIIRLSQNLYIKIPGGGVVEIGGGNGILNLEYNKHYPLRDWLIVEPSNIKPIDGVKAEYIKEMWDENFDASRISSKYSVIVHSHVLEHLLNINSFLEKIWKRLDFRQKMIFSVPNLKETLKRCYTNALNFEHTYMITDDYIEALLEKYGFNIVDKKYFREEHSIFYAAEKVRGISNAIHIDVESLYKENLNILQNFITYHQKFIYEVNEKIGNASEKVYLFGAHIFSQYLISFGLNTSRICGILDNDKLKQGKRLYGTDLMVYSPQILKKEKSPIVILKVASYAEEIKEDILNNINKQTVFVE